MADEGGQGGEKPRHESKRALFRVDISELASEVGVSQKQIVRALKQRADSRADATEQTEEARQSESTAEVQALARAELSEPLLPLKDVSDSSRASTSAKAGPLPNDGIDDTTPKGIRRCSNLDDQRPLLATDVFGEHAFKVVSHRPEHHEHVIDVHETGNIDSFCPQLSLGTAGSTAFSIEDTFSPVTADMSGQALLPFAEETGRNAGALDDAASDRTVSIKAHRVNLRVEPPAADFSMHSTLHDKGDFTLAKCFAPGDEEPSDADWMLFFSGDPVERASQMRFIATKTFAVSRHGGDDEDASPQISTSNSYLLLGDLEDDALSPPLQADPPGWESLPFGPFNLPSDVVEVEIEPAGTLERPMLGVSITRRVPVIGFILLAASLLCASSSGAALRLQDPAGPFLKCFWRSLSTLLCCIPWVALSRVFNPQSFASLRDWQLLRGAMLAGLGMAAYNGFFVLSLSYTSMSHSFVLGNCASLFIVLGRILMRMPTVLLEILGTGIGILGAMITTLDDRGGSDFPEARDFRVGPFSIPADYMGDAFALLSSLGGVLYLLQSKAVRSRIQLPVFAAILLTTTIPVFLLGSFLLDGRIPTFDMNPTTGLFGFMSSKQFAMELLAGPISLLGLLGYVIVLKYLDPLVVSVVMLSEPVIGTAMGVVVDVADWPGLLTWLGGLTTLIGTFMVTWQREKTEEVVVKITGVSSASENDE